MKPFYSLTVEMIWHYVTHGLRSRKLYPLTAIKQVGEFDLYS
jgi:hypothetical protein